MVQSMNELNQLEPPDLHHRLKSIVDGADYYSITMLRNLCDNRMNEIEREYNKDSLVSFCLTGKFIDEIIIDELKEEYQIEDLL